MVEKRCPDLETVRHARTIDLDQDVARKIRHEIDVQRLLQRIRVIALVYESNDVGGRVVPIEGVQKECRVEASAPLASYVRDPAVKGKRGVEAEFRERGLRAEPARRSIELRVEPR
ncbi:MAG: hypothetical protein M0002_11650 [Rhodospirillales bacterium]|nr:hypothetical protein [Rhodospirillales bacterium]